MLSTSILSRPRGPRELLTIFEMDCAAITVADISDSAQKKDRERKQTILVSNVLTGYPVTTKESPCSRIALEEPGHFFGAQEERVTVTEVGLINYDLGTSHQFAIHNEVCV